MYVFAVFCLLVIVVVISGSIFEENFISINIAEPHAKPLKSEK